MTVESIYQFMLKPCMESIKIQELHDMMEGIKHYSVGFTVKTISFFKYIWLNQHWRFIMSVYVCKVLNPALKTFGVSDGLPCKPNMATFLLSCRHSDEGLNMGFSYLQSSMVEQVNMKQSQNEYYNSSETVWEIK